MIQHTATVELLGLELGLELQTSLLKPVLVQGLELWHRIDLLRQGLVLHRIHFLLVLLQRRCHASSMVSTAN